MAYAKRKLLDWCGDCSSRNHFDILDFVFAGAFLSGAENGRSDKENG